MKFSGSYTFDSVGCCWRWFSFPSFFVLAWKMSRFFFFFKERKQISSLCQQVSSTHAKPDLGFNVIWFSSTLPQFPTTHASLSESRAFRLWAKCGEVLKHLRFLQRKKCEQLWNGMNFFWLKMFYILKIHQSFGRSYLNFTENPPKEDQGCCYSFMEGAFQACSWKIECWVELTRHTGLITVWCLSLEWGEA